jgi:hypothetical protein
MRYRVSFRQRFNAEGEPSDAPQQMVEAPEGVIQDATFVETLEPPSAAHPEEAMEEDDNFLAFGTSVWVYDVAEGREEEFRTALAETDLVLEVEDLRDTPDYLL